MDEPELETTDSTNGAGEATETAEERLAKLEETNKKLFERAKKAEADAKALKERTITNQQEITKPSEILKAPEFRLSRQGYDEDEIDLIMRNGGPDILKDEKNIITQGIKVSREQKGAEEAASQVSDSSGLSDIERKYGEKDLRNMTKEDLEKLLPHTDN
jgi:hypothetical protein